MNQPDEHSLNQKYECGSKLVIDSLPQIRFAHPLATKSRVVAMTNCYYYSKLSARHTIPSTCIYTKLFISTNRALWRSL